MAAGYHRITLTLKAKRTVRLSAIEQGEAIDFVGSDFAMFRNKGSVLKLAKQQDGRLPNIVLVHVLI